MKLKNLKVCPAILVTHSFVIVQIAQFYVCCLRTTWNLIFEQLLLILIWVPATFFVLLLGTKNDDFKPGTCQLNLVS